MKIPFAFLAPNATPTFDPATLPLTGWWRDYGGASPWVGSASAGTSAAHALTEASHPPTAGTALNGHGVASFARASSQKLGNESAISNFVSAGAWSVWALVNMISEDTNNAPAGAYDNDAIISDRNTYWSCCVRVGPKFQAYQFGSGPNAAESSFTNGIWQLLQFRFDGTNLEVRVNNGSWVQQAQTNIGLLTAKLYVGCNYNAAAFINGDIAELATSNQCLTDLDFDNVRSYMHQRYGVTV